MGTSCIKGNSHSRPLRKVSNLLSMEEEYVLRLIARDLSSRSAEKKITKEAFCDFFNLKNCWPSFIFNKYFNREGDISQDQFIRCIAQFSKSSQKKKQQNLYRFFQLAESYEVQESEGMSFKCFVQNLYTCSKQDLLKVLKDDPFLQQYIRKRNPRKQKTLESINSTNSTIHQKTIEREKKQLATQLEIEISDTQSQRIPSMYGFKTIVDQIMKQRNDRIDSVLQFDNQRIKVVFNNFNGLIKKFAEKIFEENHVQKSGRLKQQHFTKIFKEHQNLFNVFNNCVRQQIWTQSKLEDQLVPRYIIEQGQYSCPAIYQHKSYKQDVILKLINNTLIGYKPDEILSPLFVIILNGLSVKKQPYGLQIRHSNQRYSQTKLYFRSKEEQIKCFELLKNFQGHEVTEKYALVKTIGKGRISTVYEGRDKQTNQKVVIKQIAHKLISSYSLSSIGKESQVMDKLDSPYCIKHIQTIKKQDKTYVITQLAEGKQLYDFIKSTQKIPETVMAEIARQILIGVKQIHKKGFIHRDLHPCNIMIKIDESFKNIKIKIIDFELSIADTQSILRAINQTYNPIVGSRGYMSPQILQNQIVTYSADNYAIGQIIRMMVTKKCPNRQYFDYQAIQLLEYSAGKRKRLSDIQWDQYSLKLANLVGKLLIEDSEQRISINDALCHPWFEETHRKSK